MHGSGEMDLYSVLMLYLIAGQLVALNLLFTPGVIEYQEEKLSISAAPLYIAWIVFAPIIWGPYAIIGVIRGYVQARSDRNRRT